MTTEPPLITSESAASIECHQLALGSRFLRHARVAVAVAAALGVTGCAPDSNTSDLDGLMSLAPRPCVVVDAARTANCGRLGLQYGTDAATWLKVLSGDPSLGGQVVVYGDSWAAWGPAADVKPYVEAGGKSLTL